MSTPCSEFLAQVQPFIDGELVERPLHDFEGHVAACPGCAASLRGQELFSRRVRACLRPCAAPEPLRRRVGLALDAEDLARARASRRVRLGRLVVAAIGAAALAAAGVAAECARAGCDGEHPSRPASEAAPSCAPGELCLAIPSAPVLASDQ
ncbi:MAG TPA: zf-HC2 domain-containing protein [Kofleriaceae bacterium]|nr:zf-HC2 domain-containing protein [Kofleriaceae bacterium]